MILREMLRSKIHRATVTQAELHYVGSITVDVELLDAAGLFPGERVDVVNITNGARLTTYTIAGPRNSGVIGINGAAARLVAPGDLVIVIGYAAVPDDEARDFTPSIVFVDAANRIIDIGCDAAAANGADLVRGDVVRSGATR